MELVPPDLRLLGDLVVVDVISAAISRAQRRGFVASLDDRLLLEALFLRRAHPNRECGVCLTNHIDDDDHWPPR